MAVLHNSRIAAHIVMTERNNNIAIRGREYTSLKKEKCGREREREKKNCRKKVQREYFARARRAVIWGGIVNRFKMFPMILHQILITRHVCRPVRSLAGDSAGS